MDRLQVLLWIVCAVISVNSSIDSQLGQRYMHVWRDFRDLQADSMNLKTEIKSEFIKLVNRTFIELDKRETERLKDGYSSCFRGWMELLRADIGSLMIKEYPAPCSELLLQILNEIDRRMTEGDTEIGEITIRIDRCMRTSQNCTSPAEVATLRRRTERLKEEWFQYKKYEFIPKWRRMISCFGNLSVSLERKLFKLSDEHNGRCGKGTYQELLQDLGLLPLSIHHLIGSSMDWFRVDESPSTSPTNGSTHQEISEIMQTLNSLKAAIIQYVGRNMTFAMMVVINRSVYDIAELIKFISNPNSLPKKNRLCYNEEIRKLQDTAGDCYENHLRDICFHGLVDAKNEFTKVAHCDLQAFEKRLSEIRNCWAAEEVCEKIASRLEEFRSSLYSWKQFNLNPAMEAAKDCYSEATHLIFREINSSVEDLRNCNGIRFPEIHNNITRNMQSYPPYETSQLCFLQPEDMGY